MSSSQRATERFAKAAARPFEFAVKVLKKEVRSEMRCDALTRFLRPTGR